jgi:hypothetical protein
VGCQILGGLAASGQAMAADVHPESNA